MMEKVTAYRAGKGAPLETDPLRAYAWKLTNISDNQVGFSDALWILQNGLDVSIIISQYEKEVKWGE